MKKYLFFKIEIFYHFLARKTFLFLNKKQNKMTEAGLTLDASVSTGIANVATGLAKTIWSVGPQIFKDGLMVVGSLIIVNKLFGWFKRFVG